MAALWEDRIGYGLKQVSQVRYTGDHFPWIVRLASIALSSN